MESGFSESTKSVILTASGGGGPGGGGGGGKLGVESGSSLGEESSSFGFGEAEGEMEEFEGTTFEGAAGEEGSFLTSRFVESGPSLSLGLPKRGTLVAVGGGFPEGGGGGGVV